MLFGEGIRLRAIEQEDLPLFVRWMNDPEVIENLLMVHPLSLTQEQDWYKGVQSRPLEERPLLAEIPGAQGVWRPIGNTGFLDFDWRNRCAEIGIFIGEKELWSQGYGGKMLRLMLRHGFDTLNLNRIYLHVFETNPRGVRAYEKVGFVHEGRLRKAIFKNGHYFDILVMSVLRDEWNDQNEERGSF